MTKGGFKRFTINLISSIVLLILDDKISPNVMGAPWQCSNYHNLTERTRNINFDIVRIPRCDRKINQSLSWYRFTGKAGSILATRQVSTGKCGAINPGWLNGNHPCTIHQTTNVTVCFADTNSDCGARVNISITLCEKYYVYQLAAINSTTHCSSSVTSRRYCGQRSKVPVSSCNNTNILVQPTKLSSRQTTNEGKSLRKYKHVHTHIGC